MHYYFDVLKKYAVFKGRARRAEFWYFTLFSSIISIIINIISIVINDDLNILGLIYGLGILVPSLAVSVRRLHDVGKSGWMMFLMLIPIIGAVWLLVLNCTNSQAGDNKYGPNPKGISSMPPTTPTETFTPPQTTSTQ